MISKKEIALAVTEILQDYFPECEVYADEAQEEFSLPAFFLELLRTTENQTVNFNQNELTVVVTYLPKLYTALSNMETEEKIKEAFGMHFRAGGRVLKIHRFSVGYTGDNKEILQVSLHIQYFDDTGGKRATYPTARKVSFNIKREGDVFYGVTTDNGHI